VESGRALNPCRLDHVLRVVPQPAKRFRAAIRAATIGILGCACAREPAPDQSGRWTAELQHGGSTAAIHLGITRAEDGSLSGTLSLPSIDVWESPIGALRYDGKTLSTGLGSFRWDPRAGVLSGVMPAALVPVHRIDVHLRPGDPEPPPVQTPPEAPSRTPVWTVDLGSPLWGAVTAAGPTAWVGTEDGAVHAFDAATGETLWRFVTEGAIRAAPTVDDEALYVHSDDGHLYRLLGRTGELQWRRRLGEPTERLAYGSEGYRYDHAAASASVAEGLVVVAHGRELIALEAMSGDESWRFETADLVTASPTLDRNLAFIGSWDGFAYALDLTSGAEAWKLATGAPVTSSAAFWNDLVFFGSRSYDLLALDRREGTTVWSHYQWFSWIESSPVVRGTILYVGSSDAQLLQAFDAASGERRWSFDTGGSAWAQPAVTGERVFLGTVGVANYLVDHRATFWAVDRETGTPIWKYEPTPSADGSSIWGFPAAAVVVGGKVLVGGLDGRLLAFDP